MKPTPKLLIKLGLAALTLCIGLLLAGCETLADSAATNTPPAPPVSTPGNGGDIFSVGDPVTIVFSDLPPPQLQPFEERVKDDGSITLLHNKVFQAAGKTRRQLEEEIHDAYVPGYYVHLTVTVQPAERFYYVNGEVKLPARLPYPGNITVIKAIASAGGFTDYANKRKVRLTRAAGQTLIVNCEDALDNPKLDLPVYPGDKLDVPRSLL